MNEARPPGPAIDGEAAAALMEPLTELVVRAGAAILAVNRAAMKIDGKSDGSPVTEADLAADRIIGEGLARLAPQIPALSEERVHLAQPPYAGSFFLIDPLDGTKEFVAGRAEFTVNLALVTQRNAAARHHRRAGARIDLARAGRPRRRTADDARWRRRLRPSRSVPAPCRRAAAPGSSPSAARMATPGPKPLSRAGPARVRQSAGIGGQIRPGGRGRRRHLSPPLADLRMGHRGRPRHRHRRRRQGHRRARRRAAIRTRPRRLYRAGIHRLGRSGRGGVTFKTVIPGWSEGPDPESRDSGFDAAHRPGMTE